MPDIRNWSRDRQVFEPIHGQLNTWTCIKIQSQAISGPPLKKKVFSKNRSQNYSFCPKNKSKTPFECLKVSLTKDDGEKK